MIVGVLFLVLFGGFVVGFVCGVESYRSLLTNAIRRGIVEVRGPRP